MRARTLVLTLLLASSACVTTTQLIPDPDIILDAEAATAEGEGVRLLVDADAWRGNPPDLESVLVPLLVQVENRSGRPLRLTHGNFVLVGDSGFRFAALPPFDAGGEQHAEGVIDRRPLVRIRGSFTWGFGWGPYGPYSPWGFGGPWGFGPWWGPWGGWGAWTVPVVVEPLPTRDMVRRALPEGTLEDGGTMSGFLYFPDVGTHEQRVELVATLTDARRDKAFGTLRIPFRVQR
ncbi:MAG: hypothetical protein L0Y66_17755 [Myxococcaceae bacterium]|nr:hypothetical protein [Myxococcaceae bacterium]MCI0674087.1 hypothetical protein [Myxococcaceae bacterium]